MRPEIWTHKITQVGNFNMLYSFFFFFSSLLYLLLQFLYMEVNVKKRARLMAVTMPIINNLAVALEGSWLFNKNWRDLMYSETLKKNYRMRDRLVLKKAASPLRFISCLLLCTVRLAR